MKTTQISMTDGTAFAAWIDGILPHSVREVVERRPPVALFIRVLILVAFYTVLYFVLQRFCHLSTEDYAQPVLFIELAQRLGTLKLGVLVLGTLVLYRFGALNARWHTLEHGRELRWFVFVLAALMAWPFATLGYNYYFDQSYLLDRLLLLAALVGIWFRPAFILLFLPVAFVIMYQLVEPSMGGTILAHKQQVLRVLTLFAGVVLLHAITGARRSSDFVFLTACLVAGAYWEAALAKIELGWVTHGNLYLALFSSSAHGWLAGVDLDVLAGFGDVLKSLDWPMRLFVLGIEAGCLVFLWRRSLALTLLVSVVIFHLGVFAIFGFLFWTWILLDVALFVLLVRQRATLFLGIHGRTHFLLSVILIGIISFWAKPPHLGWFDTGLSYTMRYTAVGESGNAYALSPRFFSPYGDVFAMASFGYAIKDHARLTGPYGVVKDRQLAERIAELTTPEEVFALELEYGNRRNDAERADRYVRFLRRYLQNWNANGATREGWNWFAPPAQFWSSVVGDEYVGQEALRQLKIEEVTSLYANERMNTIRVLDLVTVFVPGASDELPDD